MKEEAENRMVEREQCRKEPEPSGRGTQVVAAMHRKLKEKVKYRCQMKCCKETRRSTRHSITRPSKNNAMGPLISRWSSARLAQPQKPGKSDICCGKEENLPA